MYANLQVLVFVNIWLLVSHQLGSDRWDAVD